MLIRIVAVVMALAAALVIYFGFFRDEPAGAQDPLAYERARCGHVDPTRGDDLGYCVELAFDLMGRSPVPIDEDAARALLKRACDVAYERACAVLADYPGAKRFVDEGRCEGSWYAADAAGCFAVGQAFEQGVGAERNWRKAREWYSRGCTLGHAESCTRKDAVVPQW